MQTFDIHRAHYLVTLAINTYKTEDQIHFEEFDLKLLNYFENKKTDTQGFIVKHLSKNEIYIAFRGANNLKDYLSDLSFFPKTYPSSKAPWLRKSKVHSGFLEAYDSVRECIIKTISEEESELYITGHSLGAALATLCAYDVKTSLNMDPILYTFGCPEIGNRSFIKKFKKKIKSSYRIVNDEDIVPKINVPGFEHVPNFILLTDNGVKTKLTRLEKIKESLDDIFSLITGEAIFDHLSKNYLESIEKIL